MAQGTKPLRRIGRYELLEEIGHGGMATVFRAVDTNLEREVALKFLHPHLTSHMESRQRFQREARAVAKLKHPAVLEIYDYSDAEGDDVFIVMELVQGITLRRFFDDQTGEPLLAEAATLLIRPVVAALAHAHENGVVHRDVKPENILIGPMGKVKLSDFGIAHLVGLSQMTTTGQILGSPAYMSPEHIEQAELDARADVFSIGTILYEMVVGRVPFEGKTPHAVIKEIVEGNYNDPISVNPAVGHELACIIRKCLATNPEKRYGSASELMSDLDMLLAMMNVEPVDEQLVLFLQDPGMWMGRLRPDIIKLTLDFGISARRKRQIPKAMDHFNRVLAFEPGNERALTAVAGMSRQRRTRRIVEKAGLVLPIIIVIAAVVWAATRRVPEVDDPLVAASNLNPRAGFEDAAPAREEKKPPAQDAGKRQEPPVVAPTTEQLTLKSQPPRVRKTRVVAFTPWPAAVEIIIDGKTRFPYEPANRKQVLSVGKHTISFVPNDLTRFEKQTWKIRIPPGDTPYSFRERLRWRPAKLLIESNVKAAVTVPGRATDKVNNPFEVRIKKGPKEQVSVLVSAEGYIPRTKQVTITAGELVKTRVNLVKSR
ncbi:MAG: protein kinase [Deltaproteobacteria bacterium]|nr:protein kinase [Deltaproteobacteria bacterium]